MFTRLNLPHNVLRYGLSTSVATVIIYRCNSHCGPASKNTPGNSAEDKQVGKADDDRPSAQTVLRCQ